MRLLLLLYTFFCVLTAYGQAVVISLSPDSAQQKGTVGTTEKEQQIETITVSALRLESRLLDATSAISAISRSMVVHHSPVALEPSLNQVPGVFMHSGSLNTNRITIRGIGSRSPYGTSKIRAYIDDIPLTSGDGESTLEDISLMSFSQVEVVRGPSSGLHGSGLGGAILLKTLPGNDNLRVQTNFTTGSFGLRKEGLMVELNQPRSSHLLVTDFLYSNGYRENNRYNRSNLFSYNRFETGENSHLMLILDFVDMKAGIPSSIDLKTFIEAPWSAAPNWKAAGGNEDVRKIRGNATFRWKTNEKTQLAASAHASLSENIELRPFNLLTERSFSTGGQLTMHYKSNSAEIQSGASLFAETYAWSTWKDGKAQPGNLLSDNNEIRYWNNLFILSRLKPLSKVVIEPGLNFNFTIYDYTDNLTTDGDASGRRKFPWILSPRIAGNWQFSSNSSVFAVLSHGFSTPSLQETLQPGGKVNPLIKPETGWNYEIGLRGRLLENQIFYDISLYHMLIRNLLVARRTGDDEFVGVNAGKTNHTGLEFDIRYQGALGNKLRWGIFSNGTVAHYRFLDFHDLGNNFSGNSLTGVPPVTINSGLDIRNARGYSSGLIFRHQDKLPLNDANSLFSEAFQLFNCRISKDFFMLNLEWKITAGINNLFNIRYASMFLINAPQTGAFPGRYYYPGLPRNFFLNVAATFRK